VRIDRQEIRLARLRRLGARRTIMCSPREQCDCSQQGRSERTHVFYSADVDDELLGLLQVAGFAARGLSSLIVEPILVVGQGLVAFGDPRFGGLFGSRDCLPRFPQMVRCGLAVAPGLGAKRFQTHGRLSMRKGSGGDMPVLAFKSEQVERAVLRMALYANETHFLTTLKASDGRRVRFRLLHEDPTRWSASGS
jgi:hypothetical protein